MRYGRADSSVPGSLDSQKLLSRFHAEIARRLTRTLDQEAVLTLVHVLGFAHHAEQRLVDLEGEGTA